MIKSIQLKFGRAPGLAPVNIDPSAVTVFVGPNNSGKSKILREIQQFCSSGNKNKSDVIVESIEFEGFTSELAEKKVQGITLRPHVGEATQAGHIFIGKRGTRHHVPKAELLASLQNPNAKRVQFCQWYLAFNTLMLDGQSRISLVNDQKAGDLQQSPQTSFQVLLRNDERREEIREIVHEAFDRHFVIDPTNLGNLRIRLSDNKPETPLEERGIHKEAVEFHSKAQHISEASDGVKAFTGMLTEIVAGDPSILLIDEPEAFLHPALSSKLGKEVAKASLESDKRVFVSTHSPSFVMGCIQSGAPVNIIRLTYRDKVPTARILPNEDILRLMRNPLLRSTNVLNGLFFEFVVVAESDADRAFYQEINERLLRFKPKLGIPNCLFINAQNKQTVQTIIKPLRELGIPTVGVVDVDILKEGGSVFTSFLQSGFIPDISHEPMSHLRSTVKKKLETTGKDMKRDGGIELLEDQDKEAANDLFDQLAAYGLFVVRGGELESWLKSLGASGHGPNWLIEIFEIMGEDPDKPDYIKPDDIDVWKFIGQVKKWLVNPARKGIPS